MIDAYWGAGARVAHEGESVYSRRGGGTRIGERDRPPGRQPLLRPGVRRAGSARRSPSPRPPTTTDSVFDNGLPLGRTDWIRDGELTALLQTRHSAAMTGQPVTPMVDNLVLEVDGASRHRSRTWSPAPSAACC